VASSDRTASNYSGKSGKTNVQHQGQTDSGFYGSNYDAKRRVPHPPQEVRP
jgi:hypothetical protein